MTRFIKLLFSASLLSLLMATAYLAMGGGDIHSWLLPPADDPHMSPRVIRSFTVQLRKKDTAAAAEQSASNVRRSSPSAVVPLKRPQRAPSPRQRDERRTDHDTTQARRGPNDPRGALPGSTSRTGM